MPKKMNFPSNSVTGGIPAKPIVV